MSLKRLIPVMALVVACVMALGGGSALAQGTSDDGDRDDDTMGAAFCVLNPGSVSGQAAPDEDGVNAFENDIRFGDSWDPLELFDTDPGHFDFGGTATCFGFDLADEDDVDNPAAEDMIDAKPDVTEDDSDGAEDNTGPEVVGPVQVDITAAGDYDNLFCGTGTANGDAILSTPDGSIYIETTFGISFVFGVGHLSFTVTSDNVGANDVEGQWDHAQGNHVGKNNIDGGEGGGKIVISATRPNGGNCGSTNVTAFDVNGGFGGSLSGEGDDDGDGSTVADGDAGDEESDSDL